MKKWAPAESDLIQELAFRLRECQPDPTKLLTASVIISPYFITETEILGMKHIYCPTASGFMLGNNGSYEMCRAFEDAHWEFK